MQAQIVLEAFEDNPFLERFYSDRDRYAFQTQLCFLMSRFHQQQELAQTDLFRPSILADYHLLKDRIFARLTLRDDELSLYDRIFNSLEAHILQPDVLVYLTARQEVLLERIRKRGRSYEANFDPEYLLNLSELYEHYFAHYEKTPLLRLDTSDLDCVSSDETIEAIYAQIVQLAEARAA